MTSCNTSTPITDEYIFHKGGKIIAKSGLKADSEKKKHLTGKNFLREDLEPF